MGNAASASKEIMNSDLVKEIDKIATSYILSQNIDDMKKIASDKGECDKLVFLTSKIIDKNLTSAQQKEVLNRIKTNASVPTNAPAPTNVPAPAPTNVPVPVPVNVPANAELVGGKKTCDEIAAFYVKIAHLYAAIMKTINPIIVTEKNGKKNKYDLMSNQNKPTEEEIKNIQHNNFCSTRLNMLMNQQKDFILQNPTNNKMYTIFPRFCTDDTIKNGRKFYKGDITIGGGLFDDDDERGYREDRGDRRDRDMYRGDIDRDRDRGERDRDRGERDRDRDRDRGDRDRGDRDRGERDRDRGERDRDRGERDRDSEDKYRGDSERYDEENDEYKSKTIFDKPLTEDKYEIGIPEFIKLYYDVYDPTKGDYTDMSPEMKIIYNNDLEEFYKALNNNNEIKTDKNGNKEITKFEQLKLNDLSKECKDEGPYHISSETAVGEENLFKKYKAHIIKMNSRMNGYQNELLAILKKIFDFSKIEKDIENIKNPEKKEEEAPAVPEPAVPEPAVPVPVQEPVETVQEPTVPVPAPAQAPAQEHVVPVQAPAVPAQVPAAQAPTVPAAVKNGGGEKESVDFVTLDPELNDDFLKKYTNSARKIIMDMYINCEKDFLEGIHIFESIIARTLGFTNQQKLDSLNATILQIYDERK